MVTGDSRNDQHAYQITAFAPPSERDITLSRAHTDAGRPRSRTVSINATMEHATDHTYDP